MFVNDQIQPPIDGFSVFDQGFRHGQDFLRRHKACVRDQKRRQFDGRVTKSRDVSDNGAVFVGAEDTAVNFSAHGIDACWGRCRRQGNFGAFGQIYQMKRLFAQTDFVRIDDGIVVDGVDGCEQRLKASVNLDAVGAV